MYLCIQNKHFMEKFYTGDPSDIIQFFPKFNLQIHCCRYWWIKHWEHESLSFPFWRIYNNDQKGAYMEFEKTIVAMDPDKLYLIAPNTNFSSKLYNYPIPKVKHNLKGGHISGFTQKEHNTLINEGAIDHLFIHFTLGYPYDLVAPGIYTFNKDKYLEQKINLLKNYLKIKIAEFNFTIFLTIESLICELLSKLDEDVWRFLVRDVRVIKVINHIENNIHKDFSNESLADIANMATNSFSRLFKEHTGDTLQLFITKKRIHSASLLLLHSDLSIDSIAEQTGFTNRYHFTRVFSKITGKAPAKYKKESLYYGFFET